MKLPVNLVNNYLKNKLSTDGIVVALERTEVEVEEIISSIELDKKIVTAKVLKVLPHPNADKLRIAELVIGKDKFTVVCGAPNLKENMIVAYAQPGSVLPDGNKIKVASLRGQKSQGMLCSAKELGINDDHSGLLELDPSLPLGISLCDIENTGDIIDIKTPANRWDMLSVLGLAREIAANSPGNDIRYPKSEAVEYSDSELVKNAEIGECSRFISVKLSVKHNSKSPAWLVDNLLASGMRSINPIVDITNFVMIETGQPSHAYDYSKLEGSPRVRFAKPNEIITTLDKEARNLTKHDLVIADKKGPVAIAGVMGGLKTEVDEDTKEILIEVANFNKTTVRRSALRHGIRTESSGRFEKGLPLPLQDFAMQRLLYLFKDICGASITQTPNDQLYAWPWVQHLGLRLRRADKFIGVKLDEKQLIDGLRSRGFDAEHFSLAKESAKHLGKPYLLGASYKTHKTDAFDCSYLTEYLYSLIGVSIGHTAKQQFDSGNGVEIADIKPGDLIFLERDFEDQKLKKERDGIRHVGMYVGNKGVLEASYDAGKVVITELKAFEKSGTVRGIRRYVSSFNHIISVTCPWWRTDVRIEQDLYEEAAKILGYDKLPATLPQLPPMNNNDNTLVNKIDDLRNTLVGKGLFEIMTYSFISKKQLAENDLRLAEHLSVINPLSIEQEYLRSNILPSHLKILSNNRDYWENNYGFFELSRVYRKDTTKLNGKHEAWHLAVSLVGDGSATALKNVLDLISEKYDWKIKVINSESSNFVKGRYAEIYVANINIGSFGQIKPSKLKLDRIKSEVSILEIEITEKLITEADKILKPVPLYQFIDRDFTIEVDTAVYWQDITEALENSSAVKIMFISEFTDVDLAVAAKKRISFRVWFDCGPQPEQKQIDVSASLVVTCLKKSKTIVNFKVC